MALTEAQLRARLGTYDKQIASLKAANELTKKRMATKGISAASKKILAGRISANEKRMTALNNQRTNVQNTYYKDTGQYEKLLSGSDRDAYAALQALFSSYGLGSLAGTIFGYVKNGYSADTVSILLQDTKEYKERFAGNEARKKAGLPVLSAGEYLATESSYRQIMQSAGLPSGFYDEPSDFNNWIGQNVSPSEIQQRVDMATQATVLANPDYKRALNQMGISDGELVAHFLDSERALPHLQKAVATAQIGAQALSQDLEFDQAYAETLATKGITGDQAAQGYAQIGSDLKAMQNLAGIYGTSWTQREAEEGVFEGKASSVNKQKRLASQERAAFSGAAGGARGGLAQRGGAR